MLISLIVLFNFFFSLSSIVPEKCAYLYIEIMLDVGGKEWC